MKLTEIYNEKISLNQKCYKCWDSDSNRKIDYLIYHHIEASSINEAIEMLEYHEVSAHYIIDKIGNIFQVVDDNDIAFHAGISYWNKCTNLNSKSIGIEMINSNPFNSSFSKQQIKSAIDLGLNLINKYNIKSRYVLGHSDIAYNSENGLLDRKQDPSHLFDWKKLSLNGVGLYPKNIIRKDKILFKYGDINGDIKLIKQKLSFFGYKVIDTNNFFDDEMKLLTRVFNRHFNNKIDFKNMDLWLSSSNKALENLLMLI